MLSLRSRAEGSTTIHFSSGSVSNTEEVLMKKSWFWVVAAILLTVTGTFLMNRVGLFQDIPNIPTYSPEKVKQSVISYEVPTASHDFADMFVLMAQCSGSHTYATTLMAKDWVSGAKLGTPMKLQIAITRDETGQKFGPVSCSAKLSAYKSDGPKEVQRTRIYDMWDVQMSKKVDSAERHKMRRNLPHGLRIRFEFVDPKVPAVHYPHPPSTERNAKLDVERFDVRQGWATLRLKIK